MESMRDRFSGRDRMGSDRGGRDRYERQERPDRMERQDMGMGERSMRRSPSYDLDGLQIEDIADVVEQSNSKQLEVFADCIDDVKDEVFASEKEIMKALDQVAASVSGGSRSSRLQESVTAQMDPASKEEILRAVAGNTDLLLAIREVLDKKEPEPAAEEVPAAEAEKPEEPAQQEEAADPMTTALSKYYSDMEEHVHKENVKCYRNVQAAITEQSTQVVEQNRKSLTLLKIFTIASTVLTLVNIVLLLGYILGFIY